MKDEMMDDDIENVGIMQGFMDSMNEDGEDESENDDEGEDMPQMERSPSSPEILMNNLRGDMRSIDARRDELADLVGYQAATETPESVLAMLQPVLAAQGAGGMGGIGALPPSQAMAQGPQPPMMPPMPPSGAPAGAPPMGPGTPGAEMAPPSADGGIAALLGGAGAPPAEGPPPVQMARGGPVQRFQAGSNPSGVTPADGTAREDEDMLYDPAMVSAAKAEMNKLLTRSPAAVPTVTKAMEARLPEYQKALGADRKLSEAQMLFELGQRAFGFAGNVDEGGRPLKGSFLSRLAGATKTLPTAIGGQLEAMDKIDRQIKVLALQQGEKDIDQVVTQNNELLKRKTDIFKDVLRADAKLQAQKLKMGDSIWGKGDWQWNVVNMPGLTERYAQGLTKPEEDKLMASAIMQFKLGRQELKVDPVTKIPGIVQVPGVLPDFVAQAEAARRRLGLPTAPQPVMSSPTAGARPAAPEAGATAPGAVPAGAAPAAGMPPAGAPAGAPAAGAAAQGPRPMTLWATRFDVAGPGAAAVAGISSIPGLGDPASSTTLARKNAELLAERLKEAMLKSVAGSVWEQKTLDKVLAIKPSALTDPDVYGTRLIALGQALREGIASYRKMGADDSGLSPEDKGRAREKAMEYQKFLGQLGLPPAVYSEADIRKYPPGTEVLVNGVTLKRIRAPE